MRMHTIPQNVTAYEDRIVGMLIGRQFIYLAIGGITIFILLASNLGPLVIRVFLSMAIGALSAAMALLKVNDRGFDSLVLSYAKAMFGPTEWVWRKDILPMEKLHMITANVSSTLAQPKEFPEGASNVSEDNLRRVSRYQSFVAQRDQNLDREDIEILEQLDFSVPIPRKLFNSTTAGKPAMPMMTKDNFAQVRQAATKSKPILPLRAPEPITPLAGQSHTNITAIAYDEGRRSVLLRHNQQTNRSLSRQLLSSGVMPLPVRGERQITISAELKEELSELVATAPLNPQAQLKPTSAPIGTSKPAPAISASPATPTPNPANSAPLVDQSSKSAPSRDNYTNDWYASANNRQQINILGQSLHNSGINKGTTMSDSSPLPNLNTPQNNDGTAHTAANAQSNVEVIKPQPHATDEITPDLQQELQQVEAQAKQAIAQLEGQQPPTSPSDAAKEPVSPQPSMQPQDSPATPVTVNPEMQVVNEEIKLHDHHAEFAPVPGISPVIPEQAEPTPLPEAPQPPTLQPAAAQPAMPANPTLPPTQPISPELMQPTMAAPTEEQDLQSRMAAAGMTSIDTGVVNTPVAASSTMSTPASASAVALTSEPNIVNGVVLDSQGQFVPGVVVVVKNGQGEPKRALKTNKLGQFVVTTPLSNGSYMVEVDKKGLSFDIMKVELTGAVLPPVEIRAKSG